MSEIKKVAIVGAGAMGILYAHQFQNANFKTYLAANGNRLLKLKNTPFSFNGQSYLFDTIDLDNPLTRVDLVMVAVKFDKLDEIIPLLEGIIHENTLIISILNGLDSEYEIAKVYGLDRILFTTTVGMDAVRVDNIINCKNYGKLLIGELKNDTISEKVKRIQSALEKAKIAYEIPLDMQKELWWKFMVNVGMNQTSAVLRATYGVFQRDEGVRKLMENLMKEVIDLSVYEGVNLEYESDLKKRWYNVLYKLDPDGKTSMLQDVEAKRKTEVDIFAGKVLKLAREHNYSAKYNEIFYDIIKGIEKSY
ncbi:MAG: ketopantoate reductase family protein [Calditerrivibrio sp.]|uniref:ketopantoate reductase family protein n=1 Tax=Calditerrivibrio sp. TaxID=2792612 RepID=UPI003D0E53CF